MNRVAVTSALALTLFAPAARAGALVRHLPPAVAPAGEPLALEATLSSEAWDQIEAVVRGPGDAGWRRVPFVLESEDRYVANIPADEVRAPALEYFLIGREAGASSDRRVFASAEVPHRVLVRQSEDERWVERELARVSGRRSRLSIATEVVDYGSRSLGGVEVPDRYTRLDLQFAYRLLRYPLHTIRFGYTYLVGETPPGARDEGSCPPGANAMQCALEAGFRVGGWFELGFQTRSGIHLDGRAMVQATQDGFNVGGRAEVRVGAADAAHVAVGTELINDVGKAAFFRLGWDTVPSLPMAATVEVTDFPSSHRAAAVRLLYDLAYPMDNGLRIGGRIGYQARDEHIGGLTAGGNLSLDF